MKKRKNLIVDDIEIDSDHAALDPTNFPLWYEQLMKFNEQKRKTIREIALKRIKQAKPKAYEFIKKSQAELVGISPRVEYTLVESSGEDLSVTFIHGFSMPTLLYWSDSLELGFFINANLDYNDSVLNKIEGNQIERGIRGFTG